MNRFGKTPARYEPGGWMHWPEDEDYCFQFMRLLGAAQEGASTISECFLTATRITPGDDESWHREWKRIADVGKARGDCAFEQGLVETAKSNWLRASNYYRSAEHFLKPEDDRRREVFDLMENCSQLFLEHITPQGEIVQIPHEDSFMHGYFLRAPNAPSKTPVVVCFGGLDEYKDDQLYKMPRHAFARNLSLLLVDLPGQGATVRRNKLMRRSDQETPSVIVSIICWRGVTSMRRGSFCTATAWVGPTRRERPDLTTGSRRRCATEVCGTRKNDHI
jgi:hypothetical protein